MSTDQETIFESETSSDQIEQSTEQSTETTGDFQSKYVGEGKKYATLDEALKATEFAQNHIAKLETENEQLRQIEQRENAVADILAQIEANKTNGNVAATGVDLSEVEKILDSKLDAREQQSVMTSNIKSVDAKMKSMFGDKAKDEMIAKGRELGLSIEQMQNTASKSPNAFMAWFGGKGVAGNVSLKSDVNTQRLEETPVIKQGTYNYYRQLFKEKPHLRADSKINAEMHENAAKQGEAFYS